MFLKNAASSGIRLNTSAWLIGAAMAALTSSAHADAGQPTWSFSGFGTAALTHASNSDSEYVGSLYQPTGAGGQHDWSSTVDSKLGGQLTAHVTDRLSAVLQVVASNRTNNHFSPRVEWAYVSYAVTSDLSVSAGRTVLPGFMTSDTRLVGYANTSVRVPIETYNLNPTTSADGVNLSYRSHLGGATNTVQAWYGKTKVTIIGQQGDRVNGVKADALRGIADTIESGALTVRAGVTFVDLTLPIAPGVTVVTDSRVLNLGASYDPGKWFIQGELSHSKTTSASRAQRALYATAGLRWQNLTPYASFSTINTDDDQPQLRGLKQSTSSLGVRWDVRPNTALKLQLDHVKLGEGNLGFMVNAKPSAAGSSTNVATLAVDFVF